MIREFLEKLCTELSIAIPIPNEKKMFSLRFGPAEILLFDLRPGVSMSGEIGACPIGQKEDIYMYLMRANLLGQGTGGARIGLDANEKNLTLSLGLPYEMNYKAFKEAFEEFLNHLIYWQGELVKLGQK